MTTTMLDKEGRDALEYNSLREANIARQAAWCPEQVPDLSFRGCELAGEVGEALNVIKKLERERLGWRGSRDTVEHLAEELADVIICTDLVAISAGIDLDAAVARKFNATSDKVGLPHKMREVPTLSHAAGDVAGLVERLNERTKLKYVGSCKCGSCHLVPLGAITEAATTILGLSARASAAEELAWTGWISVTDKLPGEQGCDSENVLCFLNGHCDMLDMECRNGGGWGIRIGFYDAEKQCFRAGGIAREVTHWMPLPSAPDAARSLSIKEAGK
jgi:NTP pyrophosphatase (non-canonical NTP hydrolase)